MICVIKKILIANRGEIAVRIIRACREMGIETVAVYSEADAEALHTKLADEAICIGPAPSSQSYLSMENIISATVVSGADAIHPGFGFCQRTVNLQNCVSSAELPLSDRRQMSLQSLAINRKQEIRWKQQVFRSSQEVRSQSVRCIPDFLLAREIGYPVIIKAALGGGGKGMRVAYSEEEFTQSFQTAQKESQMAFGDDTMYIEHFMEEPRHIEFQILADSYGNVVHLGERDCSIQRNHQKMIEEAPSAALSSKLRKKMGEAAVKAAKAAGYVNAGTIEFLLENNDAFYFMEMNTRIQVEHPVTEWVTGIDLIKEQIRIADGQKLSFTQQDIEINGHAIECRINAENPEKGFRPSPGTITDLHLPGGKGIRVDSAIYSGCSISPYYDSMVAKLIVWAKNRDEAIQKMQSALGEVIIEGIDTNVDYLYELLNNPVYQSGEFNVNFIDTIKH